MNGWTLDQNPLDVERGGAPDDGFHRVFRPREVVRVADQSVPIVTCPRANAVLGVGRPPVRELLDHATVALGTDNVMLNPPNMFREMAYTATHFDVSAREVLGMATTAGADIAGLDCGRQPTQRS